MMKLIVAFYHFVNTLKHICLICLHASLCLNDTVPTKTGVVFGTEHSASITITPDLCLGGAQLASQHQHQLFQLRLHMVFPSLQANARTISETGPRPLPATSFPLHYLLISLLFDTAVCH